MELKTEPPLTLPQTRATPKQIALDDLICGLNEDLAAEWSAMIRYTRQSSLLIGPRGKELGELFAKEIADEFEHAKFLTAVIADLGGEPTSEPRRFENAAGLREMLELDLEMELADIQNYTDHSRMADALGETELKLKLEKIAADELRHARELHHVLSGLGNGNYPARGENYAWKKTS